MSELTQYKVYVTDFEEVERRLSVEKATIKRTLNSAVSSMEVSCKNQNTSMNMMNIELRKNAAVMFDGKVRSHTVSYAGAGTDNAALSALDVLDVANNRLVAKAYPEDTTPYDIRAILLDLLAEYFPEVGTLYVAPFVNSVTDLRFDYEPLFKCLKKLADMSGCWFYVDSDWEMHWFQDNEGSLPYTYDSSSIIARSFKISFNSTDLVNRLWVIGAKQAASSYVTQTFSYDGVNRVYSLGYIPNYVEAFDWNGSSWVAREINLESNENGGEYFLYNKVEKNISIPTSRAIPASGEFKIMYRPTIEIIDFYEDTASQEQFGLYEQAIKSRDIKTKAEARKIARTQLKSRRGNAVIVNFDTRLNADSLAVGKLITLNMPRYGLNNLSMLITDLTQEYYPANATVVAKVVCQGVM